MVPVSRLVRLCIAVSRAVSRQTIGISKDVSPNALVRAAPSPAVADFAHQKLTPSKLLSPLLTPPLLHKAQPCKLSCSVTHHATAATASAEYSHRRPPIVPCLLPPSPDPCPSGALAVAPFSLCESVTAQGMHARTCARRKSYAPPRPAILMLACLFSPPMGCLECVPEALCRVQVALPQWLLARLRPRRWAGSSLLTDLALHRAHHVFNCWHRIDGIARLGWSACLSLLHSPLPFPFQLVILGVQLPTSAFRFLTCIATLLPALRIIGPSAPASLLAVLLLHLSILLPAVNHCPPDFNWKRSVCHCTAHLGLLRRPCTEDMTTWS